MHVKISVSLKTFLNGSFQMSGEIDFRGLKSNLKNASEGENLSDEIHEAMASFSLQSINFINNAFIIQYKTKYKVQKGITAE